MECENLYKCDEQLQEDEKKKKIKTVTLTSISFENEALNKQTW